MSKPEEKVFYESKFLFLNEKHYYIRKKIVGCLLKNNLVSDKQDLRDFILGNRWGIYVEDYIIYRGGTFHFKDKKNTSSISWSGFDGQGHLRRKTERNPLTRRNFKQFIYKLF